MIHLLPIVTRVHLAAGPNPTKAQPPSIGSSARIPAHRPAGVPGPGPATLSITSKDSRNNNLTFCRHPRNALSRSASQMTKPAGLAPRLSGETSRHAPRRATEDENVGTNADVAGLKACSTRTRLRLDSYACASPKHAVFHSSGPHAITWRFCSLSAASSRFRVHVCRSIGYADAPAKISLTRSA
jgi:hypothetical protein